jgi:hypothetical protein
MNTEMPRSSKLHLPPIDAAETTRVLRLFSQKAEKLLSSTAARRSLGPISASHRHHYEEGISGSYSGPDGEAVDAFVLTLRFFIQDNESVSLARMRTLYDEVAPPDLATRFHRICKQLNNFLDQPTPLSVAEGSQLTRRQVLDYFVYGDFAHANSEKRALVIALREGPMFPLFQFVLAEAYRAFVVAINLLNNVNQELLGQLSPDA